MVKRRLKRKYICIESSSIEASIANTFHYLVVMLFHFSFSLAHIFSDDNMLGCLHRKSFTISFFVSTFMLRISLLGFIVPLFLFSRNFITIISSPFFFFFFLLEFFFSFRFPSSLQKAVPVWDVIFKTGL